MLQVEHSAILSICIKQSHGFKTFVLSIFEWPLKTDFAVCERYLLTYTRENVSLLVHVSGTQNPSSISIPGGNIAMN